MIPEGWTIKKTGELCDSIVPGRNKPRNWGGDIPWIRTEDLNGRLFIKSEDIEFKLTKEEIKRAGGKLAPKNSVIMTCVGNLGIASIISQPSSMNQQLHAFVCKKEIIALFLAYSINFSKNKIINLAQKTSVLYLNKDGCESIPILLPPLKEQEKISSVLINLDNIAFQIKKIINKLQLLKKGLMQRLFTEGIGHAEFKETRLGNIPKEWEVKKLREFPINIIDGDRGKNYPKIEDFNEKGFCLFLNTKNIVDDKFNFNICQFISKERDEILRSGKLKRNDIVLTTRGTVGSVALYEKTIPFEHIRINSGMVIIRNTSDLFNNYFLYNLFKSPLMKKQFLYLSTGSAQPQLPIRELEHIRLIVPGLKEQIEISRILSNIFKKIENENLIMEILKEIKKGLMLELLTGKKRVKIN